MNMSKQTQIHSASQTTLCPPVTIPLTSPRHSHNVCGRGRRRRRQRRQHNDVNVNVFAKLILFNAPPSLSFVPPPAHHYVYSPYTRHHVNVSAPPAWWSSHLCTCAPSDWCAMRISIRRLCCVANTHPPPTHHQPSPRSFRPPRHIFQI